MTAKIYFAITMAMVAVSSFAQTNVFPLLHTFQGDFAEATITSKAANYIIVSHPNGVAKVWMTNLPPEIQKIVGYDPEKVAAALIAKSNQLAVAAAKAQAEASQEKPVIKQTSKPEDDTKSLLESGRFFCSTNEIDDTVSISAESPTIDAELSLGIVMRKTAKPKLGLIAKNITGRASDNNREPISGFDTVRCRIGTNIFKLHQKWQPDSVLIRKGYCLQSLFWPLPENEIATEAVQQILDASTTIKVEYSSSFMGGESHTFSMSEADVRRFKDVYTLYKSLPDAAPLK